MPNNDINIVQILEDKLQGKPVQVVLGQLGTAAIKTSPSIHRDVFKVLVDADEKTAITSITGIDLGANIGVFYHVRTSNAFLTIQVELPKENPKIQTVNDITHSATLHRTRSF